jgi:phosphatidylethanolamine-binding protein (PEBP) family uncharacterized protein
VYNTGHSRLKKAEIIPTVIDDFLPSLLIKVSWPSHKNASLGNTIKPKKLQDAPTIALEDDPSASKTRFSTSSLQYTIAMTDPDAPSRDNPEWSEMCHWIATGASLSSSGASIQKGLRDIIEYKPPGPPPKTGKHRYVFIAFAPANGTTGKLNLTKPRDRQHWGTGKERHGVRDWAKENGLVPVGALSRCSWRNMMRFEDTNRWETGANFIYAKNKKQ